MRTENELTSKTQTIIGDSEENPTKLFEIKNWLSTHREKMRQKIFLKNISFSQVLTFLPFIFGLVQFLNTKINASNNSQGFFQKNLPIFANFTPQYNYETLNYILKPNSDFGSGDFKFFLGQPEFLVKLRKPFSVNSKNFSGITCDFYLLSNFSEKHSNNTLDELPSYVQGLNQKFNKTGSTNNFLVDVPQNLDNFKNNSLTKKPKKQSSALNFDPLVTTKLQLIKKESNKVNSSFKKMKAETDFSKNRLEFYKGLELLTNELQNLFIEKEIIYPLTDSKEIPQNRKTKEQEFTRLLEFLEKNETNDTSVLVELILKNLEKTKISHDLQDFRLMSGYNYPDVSSAQLYWFYKQNSLVKKFPKPGNSTFTDPKNSRGIFGLESYKYSFQIQNLPRILVETKKLILQDTESKKVFYNGPSLVLNSNQAFDWKTRGEKNLRSWFHEYISPLNPFTQIQNNYFGIYHSPKFASSQKLTNFPEFTKKSLLEESFLPTHNRWDLVRSPLESNLIPFISSFHISSENNTQGERFIRGLQISTSSNEDSQSTDQFIPIIQIQQPNFRICSNSEKSFTGYSPFFDLGITAKPDYNFSVNSFTDEMFTTKYSSGRYKKIASVFSKKSRFLGSGIDNWEPLTSTSWLVISQLSFAVLIFHVLKSLADNYGRELLGYLLDLVASLGFLDDSLKQEIEILMGQREKGFRVVLKSQKNFTDIVGIEKFLPEIYEVVWFLRNSARDFALSKTLPRGILLTGPPGTGKTLLVQALAGEAQVPVVVLSGSSLIEPGESGSVKLEMVFQEARQVAPCIVFIDEIDTLAQKRSGVVNTNPMAHDELIELLTSFENRSTESPIENLESSVPGSEGVQHNLQQLGLLTQLLVELDGIQGRDGVIVIGATNRPEVLDPALLRPGRFDKILQVSLPKEEKRVEILKFYGQKLGYTSEIPWNYLGARTAGFTAADLAALMNESAIKAILTRSNHTIETIEHGIDRLTTSENEKYSLLKTYGSGLDKEAISLSSKLSILRLAYYQAGKILLSYLLEMHPKIVFASLWPRRPNMRSVQITTNLQNTLFDFARLCEINDRLVGCYAGKAAEFLFVRSFSTRRSVHFSTLGLEDLLFGQKMIYSFLEKSFFYSKRSHRQKSILLTDNINFREFPEMPEKIDLYQELIETIQAPPTKEIIEAESSSLKSEEKNELDESQIYYSIPWWQQETSNALEFVEKNFSNWSRIYLSNPELNERNPEWVPPDEFFHTTTGLKNVKTAFSNVSKRKIEQQQIKDNLEGSTSTYPTKKVYYPWNEISDLTRDYPAHSLVLQSFNKALVLLNQNRELLDRLVIELLRHEILRQPEIELLFKEFQINIVKTKEDESINTFNRSTNKKEIQILENSWGLYSRKPLPRWIDFTEFCEETT